MDPTALAAGSALASLAAWYLHLPSVVPRGQQVWVEWMVWATVLGVCKLRGLCCHRAAARATRSTAKAKIPSASSPLATMDEEERSIPSLAYGASSSPLKNSRGRISLLAVLLFASRLVTIFAGEPAVRWALPIVALFVFLPGTLSRRPGSEGLLSKDGENSNGRIDYDSYDNDDDQHGGVVFSSEAIIVATTCIVSSLGLIFTQAKFDYHVFGLGLGYAAVTATGYSLLVGIMCRDESSSSSSPEATDRAFLSRLFALFDAISVRAFVLCTLFLALTSTPIPALGEQALIFVALRIAQLFFTVTLCSTNSPLVAAAIATAASAVTDDMLTKTPLTYVVDLFVAAAALAQGHRYTSTIRPSRVLLFALLIIPLMRMIFAAPAESASPTFAPPPQFGPIHPVEQLVKTNRELFEKKLASQSDTVEAAVKEYVRRWGRPPPPGFGKWWEVAKSKDFLFIDELDTIMQSLEPFWGISPASLRARMKSVQKAERVSSVTVAYGSVSQSEDHYLVDDLKLWLNHDTWGEALPEVNFIISHLDEPRVVVPDDTLDLAMQQAQEAKDQATPQPWWTTETQSSGKGRGGAANAQANSVQWISVGQQHAWEAMVSSCHIHDPARSETGAENKTLYPFVGNVSVARDVCASSDRLHNHGFFASPQSLIVTHSLVPIFSQCKPSIFNDILYPSPYYQGQITSGDYDEADDPAWDDKLDRMYWVGASTGGYATRDNWQKLHRQRLTLTTSAHNAEAVHLLERDERGEWQPRVSEWQTLAGLFYTRLTAVIQCAEEACNAQTDALNVTSPEPKTAALGSKYLLDIDGNSFSGRYYRLLKSRSAVLKSTVFQEWHDDRLVPWVHYIPVSSGAHELGELMRFLVDEPEGRAIGERVARESREWTRKTLRTDDLEVAFVRVLMEYARIIDDDRDRLNFE